MDHISVELSENIQTLAINRPEKKNAITNAMYGAMAEAIISGDQNPDIAVHLLTGTGGVFTAGNDIGEFLGYALGGEGDIAALAFLKAIATAQKPLVAAVDGLAIGIGTTLLFHFDLVYATAHSEFRTPFLDLGLVPEGGSSLLMPQKMGRHRAFEMLCLGETFDAQKALMAGFVNKITTPETLQSEARAAALRLAAKPPAALAMARKLLRGDQQDIVTRIDDEAALFKQSLRSNEAREAFSAFMEKRPANFKADK